MLPEQTRRVQIRLEKQRHLLMKITYKIALISPVDFKRDKITVSRLNNEFRV